MRLKKLLAEAMLDSAVLKDVASKNGDALTPATRRVAVTAMRDAHGISERRACSFVSADRSTVRYRRPGRLTADSDDVSHRFRSKPAIDSDRNQPPVPIEASREFR